MWSSKSPLWAWELPPAGGLWGSGWNMSVRVTPHDRAGAAVFMRHPPPVGHWGKAAWDGGAWTRRPGSPGFPMRQVEQA